VALHTAYVRELDLLPYLALTTTTGTVQLWQGDIVQWTREEGLSAIQVAEMVELPERKTIAAHIDQDETFAERIRRQLADVKVRFRSVQRSSHSITFVFVRGCPIISSTSSNDLRRDPMHQLISVRCQHP